MSCDVPTTTDATIDMPAPTIAPFVLALSLVLLAAGIAMNIAFAVVGGLLFVVGLGMWINQLLPGRGHVREELVTSKHRARAAVAARPLVQQMTPDMAGYRLRLPERVHPVSAGIKGGLVGGVVMPLPAMAYGVLSGHGIWLPINLLAGMAVPGVGTMSAAELAQFHPTLFGIALAIHVSMSLIIGLIYGVLLPMLTDIPKPLAWGAILMPMLWTAVCFIALGMVSPRIGERIEWPWFVVSQFVFGVVAAIVYMRFAPRRPIAAGILGGLVGGLVMPIPAILWGLISGHGIWYPVNLLSAIAIANPDGIPASALTQYRADWFTTGIVVHAILSLLFGLAFSLVLPRLPKIPSAIGWGGLVMPMLWTSVSYGMMGIVNPVLQDYVDWPWFIASQFVFGIVAASLVMRSEQIAVPPAGKGPDLSADYLTT